MIGSRNKFSQRNRFLKYKTETMSSTVVWRKRKVSYFLFSSMMDKKHAEVFYVTIVQFSKQTHLWGLLSERNLRQLRAFNNRSCVLNEIWSNDRIRIRILFPYNGFQHTNSLHANLRSTQIHWILMNYWKSLLEMLWLTKSKQTWIHMSQQVKAVK